MTRAFVLNVLSPKTITLMLVSFTFFILFAVAMPSSARAAALTSAQVESVVDLLKAFNADSHVVSQVEVTLRENGHSENTVAPTCTLTTDKSEVTSGEQVTLTWVSTNADYASNRGGGVGPTQGSIILEPKESSTYVKTVYGKGGAATCTAEVAVVDVASDNKTKVMVHAPVTVQSLSAAAVNSVATLASVSKDILEQLFMPREKNDNNTKLLRELKEKRMASTTVPVKSRIASTTPEKDRRETPQGLEKNNFPGASACAFLVRNLKRGEKGEDVKKLQEYLQTTGDFKEKIDGTFGPATEEAVKKIQARYKIISSGDATSTGYGAIGPRTRTILVAHCKALFEKKVQGQGTSATSNVAAPTCTLTVDKSEVTSGEQVTLTWTSTNATRASMPGGTKGPAHGSLNLAVTETSTFQKRVFGPGGEGTCTATVTVTGDTSAPETKVVTNVVDKAFTSVGQTLAAAITAYFGFFGVKF